jgi:hypothetical protein
MRVAGYDDPLEGPREKVAGRTLELEGEQLD